MSIHNLNLERQKEDKKKYFPFAKSKTIDGRLYIDIDSALNKILKPTIDFMFPKDLMEEDMKALPFVKWDRFVVNKELFKLDLYGWIDREKDSYKDFVLLEYQQNYNATYDTNMSTSSAKATRRIFDALQMDGEHHDCQRVEKHFKIDNCVRLDSDLK